MKRKPSGTISPSAALFLVAVILIPLLLFREDVRTPDEQAGNFSTGVPGPWRVVADYPGPVIEGMAVVSDGRYAYVAGGLAGGAASSAVHRYDSFADTWSPLASMPAALYDARAAYAAGTNSIYVFGGYDGAVLDTTYVYNLATNTWTTGASLPAARIWPNVAYDPANGRIYVVGGLDSSFRDQGQTWEYDPVADTWSTTRANAPVTLTDSVTSFSGGFLYLAGGFGGGTGSTVHYRYDVANDSWAPMAPVPVAVRGAAGGNIGGRNYLVGGGAPSRPALARNSGDAAFFSAPDAFASTATSAYTSTWIYDIDGDSWTKGSSTNVPHSWSSGTALGNSLLVIGGFDGGSGDIRKVELAAPYGTIVTGTITAISITLTPTRTRTPTNTPTNTAVPPTRTPTNTPTNTPSPPPSSLTALSPANVWVGLANSDDVGIRFDLRAIVSVNGTPVGSGQLDSVTGGSSGFNNAQFRTIPLTLAAPVAVSTGTTLSIDVQVRNACFHSGHNSGTARLWYNGQPIDSGATRDAGSRFDATINGSSSDYFLRTGGVLITTAGSSKTFSNAAVGAKCGPFVSFGTWSTTLP